MGRPFFGSPAMAILLTRLPARAPPRNGVPRLDRQARAMPWFGLPLGPVDEDIPRLFDGDAIAGVQLPAVNPIHCQLTVLDPELMGFAPGQVVALLRHGLA